MSGRLAATIIGGAYLIGSVPFGLIVGYLFKRVDIRAYGSGNIGATNVLRLLGWPAALLVFLLDAAKGLVPVWLAITYAAGTPLLHVAAALAAILGHNYSVFLKFRGGKGVATSLGVLIALVPEVAALVFFIWVLMVVLTRYISVASMVAGASVPVLMLLSSRAHTLHTSRPIPDEYIYLALFGAGFILLKHRTNLNRLSHGTEPRIGQRVRLERVTGKEMESDSDAPPQPKRSPDGLTTEGPDGQTGA